MFNRIQLDLSAKKTERDWLATSDRFWLSVTPKLFEWLGWVALLAGVLFVQKKSGSAWLTVLTTLCWISLMFYYFAFFARIEFTGFIATRPNLQRVLSIMLSSCLAGAAYVTAQEAAGALTIGTP